MEWNRHSVQPRAAFKKTAQSLGELAILLALVIAAMIGMQAYLKRGLQARYKAIVDAAGDAVTYTGKDMALTALRQYEPYYASSVFTSTADSDTNFIQTARRITAVINDASTAIRQQSVGHKFGGDDGWNW